MKKILVFLFAFLLLVECIRVTGLFRRLLQRHSLRGKVKIADHFPDSKLKVVSSLPPATGCGERGDDLGEDLHAKVTARGRGYHLRHLSCEPPQHPISSRSTSRISP